MGIYKVKKLTAGLLALILIFTSLITFKNEAPVHAEGLQASIEGNLQNQPVKHFSLDYRNNVELDKDQDKIYITFPEGMPVKKALENSRYAVSIYWDGLSRDVRPTMIQVGEIQNGKQTVVLSEFTSDIPAKDIYLSFYKEEYSPTLINPEVGSYSTEVYTSKNSEKKSYSFEVKYEGLLILQQGFISPSGETIFKVRNINSLLENIDFNGEIKVTANYHTTDGFGTQEEKTVNIVEGEGEFSLYLPQNLRSVSVNAYKSNEASVTGNFYKGFHTNPPNVFIKATDHNGNILEDEMMYFRNMSNDRMFGNGMETGYFSTFLEDGEYEILGIHQGAGMAQKLNISNGVAMVGEQTLTPDAPFNYQLQAPNFKITFKDEEGELYKGGQVFIFKQAAGFGFSTNFKINKDGQIVSYLPSGNYNLNSITDQFGISIGKSVDFQITEQHNESHKLELEVQPEPSNVFNNEVIINNKKVNSGSVTIVSQNVDRYDYHRISIQAFEDGTRGFKLPLAPGEYKIESIYDYATDNEYAINQSFTVEEGPEPTHLEVNNSTNVNGTIYDYNGQPAEFSHISMRDSEGNYYSASTGSAGKFYINLQNGTYTLDKVYINGTENILNRTFTVENGELVGSLEIRPVTNNFSGSLYKNSSKEEKLQNGYIIIQQNQSNNQTPIHATLKVLNGDFAAYLPDGEYKVIDVMNEAWEWEAFEELSFEMRDGNLFIQNEQKESLDVFLAEVNFSGNLFQDPAGQLPVEYRGFSVMEDKEHTENSAPEHYWIRTGANGEFKQFLPAGDYVIDGISTSKSWMQTKIKFSINTDKKLVVNGEVLENGWQVTPPAPNMTGRLLDENNVPIAHGGFSLRENKDWSENPEFVWISADENGNYSYNLPINEEGYLVEGIWDGDKFLNLDNYSETNADYQFMIDEENTLVERDIKLPTKTVEGQIIGEQDQGVIYHGISIKKKIDEYTYEYYWLSSDEDGNFAGIIPAGTYEVDGVGSNQGWISLANLEKTITSPDDNIQLEVKPNVKGSVKNNGQLISHGSLKVRPIELDPSKEPWEQEIYIQVQDGLFSAILDSDITYTILGIYQESGYTQLNQSLSVSEANEITVPENNVTGKIEGLVSEELAHAWLHIVPLVDGQPDWDNAVWARLNTDGSYTTYLKPGEYLLSGISTETKWISLDINETIVAEHNNLILDLSTAAKLDGVVMNAAGTVLPGAWIGYSISGSSTKWVQADTNGEFTIPYVEGKTYIVTDVNDANNDEWDADLNIELQPNDTTEIKTDF
jgi:hypothetical protein